MQAKQFNRFALIYAPIITIGLIAAKDFTAGSPSVNIIFNSETKELPNISGSSSSFLLLFTQKLFRNKIIMFLFLCLGLLIICSFIFGKIVVMK